MKWLGYIYQKLKRIRPEVRINIIPTTSKRISLEFLSFKIYQFFYPFLYQGAITLRARGTTSRETGVWQMCSPSPNSCKGVSELMDMVFAR